MIVVSPRAMAAIAQAYRALHECGRADEAEELIASFREPAATVQAPPPAPPTPDMDPAEKKRIRDREYAARKRLEAKKSSPESSIVVKKSSESSTTNRLESSTILLARDHAVNPSSSSETLEISKRIEREEEKNLNLQSSSLRARVVRIVAESSEKSSSSLTTNRPTIVGRQSSAEALMWEVWKQVTGAGGQGASHMQRLRDAADAIEPIAMDRGVPIPVVFKEAATRFWNDPGVQQKNLGLVVLCSQIEQWMRAAPPKRGPVHATPVEEFDTSGDDFAHLEVNHG